MKRSSFEQFHCSLAQALERMGDWWTPLIIRDLYMGIARFDELIDDLGMSRNLLSSRLKSLIEHGIVMHDGPSRGRKSYRLTDAGQDLVPILIALTAWGDKWAGSPDGPPVLFRHRNCGTVLTSTICCSQCGETIVADEVEPLPGPGGRAGPGTRLVACRLADGSGRSPQSA